MPAAAVANYTPAITGISGMSVGASGEMDDMGNSEKTKIDRHGRICCGHPRLSRWRASRRRWPGHRRAEATPSFGRLCPAMTMVNTIGFAEGTANSYFFAGAILESAGLAGSTGLVSVLLVSAVLSSRSILAESRSLPT